MELTQAHKILVERLLLIMQGEGLRVLDHLCAEYDSLLSDWIVYDLGAAPLEVYVLLFYGRRQFSISWDRQDEAI